jgi:hypothetical protein
MVDDAVMCAAVCRSYVGRVRAAVCLTSTSLQHVSVSVLGMPASANVRHRRLGPSAAGAHRADCNWLTSCSVPSAQLDLNLHACQRVYRA